MTGKKRTRRGLFFFENISGYNWKRTDKKYDELHVYADNCAGQNKNHAVSRFLLALTDTGRFKHVKQIFPVVVRRVIGSLAL